MNTTAVTVVVARKASPNALAELASRVGDDVLRANLLADAESSRGTRTANSERALRGDVLLFSAWCAGAGRSDLPASAETVAAFIDAMSEAGKAPASIKCYAASIAAYHRAARA